MDCRRWRVIAPPDYAHALVSTSMVSTPAASTRARRLTCRFRSSRMTWEGFLSAIEGMTLEEIRRMFGIFSSNAGHSLFGVDASGCAERRRPVGQRRTD